MISDQFFNGGWYECTDSDTILFKYRSDNVFQSITESTDDRHRIFLHLILHEAPVDKSPDIAVNKILDIWVGIM